MSLQEKLKELNRRNEEALQAGGKERVEKQDEAGKLTARERIELLLDPGSFIETDKFVTHRATEFGIDKQKIPGDGVVTGHGKIDGRLVFVFAQDFTVFGGSLGEVYAQQISAVMGPCAGGAVYSPVMTDFVFMVDKTSHMFITGPDVIKAVTHEEVSKEDLGGARTHNEKSGVAHFMASSDRDCIEQLRKLFGYLPSNNLEESPVIDAGDSGNPEGAADRREAKLDEWIPESANKPYDMKGLIELVVDQASFFEVQPYWAKNMLVGFARLGGRSVGIVANQPAHLAGCLDINGSIKGARF